MKSVHDIESVIGAVCHYYESSIGAQVRSKKTIFVKLKIRQAIYALTTNSRRAVKIQL